MKTCDYKFDAEMKHIFLSLRWAGLDFLGHLK